MATTQSTQQTAAAARFLASITAAKQTAELLVSALQEAYKLGGFSGAPLVAPSLHDAGHMRDCLAGLEAALTRTQK